MALLVACFFRPFVLVGLLLFACFGCDQCDRPVLLVLRPLWLDCCYSLVLAAIDVIGLLAHFGAVAVGLSPSFQSF